MVQIEGKPLSFCKRVSALAVAVEVLREVACAPDRCHHVVVAGRDVADGVRDAAAIGQQGGLGAVVNAS
jgi:hypothetical protein